MKIRNQYLAFGTPDFTNEEIDAVARVMRSGWVGMGEETIAFEQELSNYIGAPEVVTVNSCTSALFLSLMVEGVKPGDEIIVPSLTWCSTANAALYLGAVPVFCDVDAHSMCVTPETIAPKITKRTKAVVVVHYGGYPIDVDALRKTLRDDIAIIEDAAHAFGASHGNGERVGSSGNSVCFSFYANKNLSTADGGAIALFDSDKARRLRRLRMCGMESNAWSRYTKPSLTSSAEIAELGYKMNFTDLQAAIGRVQLNRFEDMTVRRKKIADRYKVLLRETVPFQCLAFEDCHARHLLAAVFNPAQIGLTRNDLFSELRKKNIGVSIHYTPLHQQPAYRNLGSFSLPTTEVLAQQIMSLPLSAKMEISDVDYVAEHFFSVLEKAKA